MQNDGATKKKNDFRAQTKYLWLRRQHRAAQVQSNLHFFANSHIGKKGMLQLHLGDHHSTRLGYFSNYLTRVSKSALACVRQPHVAASPLRVLHQSKSRHLWSCYGPHSDSAIA